MTTFKELAALCILSLPLTSLAQTSQTSIDVCKDSSEAILRNNYQATRAFIDLASELNQRPYDSFKTVIQELSRDEKFKSSLWNYRLKRAGHASKQSIVSDLTSNVVKPKFGKLGSLASSKYNTGYELTMSDNGIINLKVCSSKYLSPIDDNGLSYHFGVVACPSLELTVLENMDRTKELKFKFKSKNSEAVVKTPDYRIGHEVYVSVGDLPDHFFYDSEDDYINKTLKEYCGIDRNSQDESLAQNDAERSDTKEQYNPFSKPKPKPKGGATKM